MTWAKAFSVFNNQRVGNVAVILFFLLGAYFFGYRHMRFFRVPSSSMEPTLQRVDQIVTLSYNRYNRGDIVVVRDPEEAGSYLVKRIAGIAGDRVSVERGALFLNGEYASEPYLEKPMGYQILSPVLIPEDRVFLLGDNRNNSSDSHDQGETFPVSDIVGRVIFIYYPYARWGVLPSYPLTNRLGQ